MPPPESWSFTVKSLVPLVLLAALLVSAGCQQASNESSSSSSTPAGQNAALSGKVLETMDSGGYTYVRVDTGTREIWAAGPVTPMKVGDEVSIATGMEMRGFASNTLGKTFDSIYFVTSFGAGGADAHAGTEQEMPAGHPKVADAPTEVDLTGIAKAEGGLNVAEVWEQRSDLAGTDVVVRGRVVKFTGGVMNRNWVHIRDGSGGDGTNDLTVTTQQKVQVGDEVLVSGKAAVDKDFGAGYKYGILLEQATLEIEKAVGADG